MKFLRACRTGNVEIIGQILTSSDSETRNATILYQDETNSESSLHWACEINNVEIVKLLIKFIGPGLLYKLLCLKNNQGETALHAAFRLGYLEIIRYIIQQLSSTNQIIKLLEIMDVMGNTLLHYACRYEHYTLVELLFQSFTGAELDDYVHIKNNDGKTALDEAKAKGFTAIVTYIDKRFNKR